MSPAVPALTARKPLRILAQNKNRVGGDDAATPLRCNCARGFCVRRDHRERCLEYVRNSIGLVTALVPVLGYERSAAIAKEALKTGGSVYDLVLAKGWLSQEKLDDFLKPETMTNPRRPS